MRDAPRLETDRLVLRLAQPDDAVELARYYSDNFEHQRAFSPLPPEGFFTQAYWSEQIDKRLQSFALDQSVALIVLDTDERTMLGHANFSQFVRGPFQACYLGFSVDRNWEGKGIMFEALGAAIPYLFKEVALHRIMANHLPENARSARLLERLGFVNEGYAKNYLRIAGEWRDHVLRSLTNDDWNEQAR